MIILDLQLSPGESVLDIACGTGVVARVAKERVGRSGRVIAVDISRDMLSVARNVAPGIEFREGDAAMLPLQDGETFTTSSAIRDFSFFPTKPLRRRRCVEQ